MLHPDDAPEPGEREGGGGRPLLLGHQGRLGLETRKPPPGMRIEEGRGRRINYVVVTQICTTMCSV